MCDDPENKGSTGDGERKLSNSSDEGNCAQTVRGKKRGADGNGKPSSSPKPSTSDEERPSDECREGSPPVAAGANQRLILNQTQVANHPPRPGHIPHMAPIACNSVRLTSERGGSIMVDWVTFHTVVVNMFTPTVVSATVTRDQRGVARQWTGRPKSQSTNDGYKWRKYGQKLLTASKLHREYLRCTHPGCPARKHIEVVPATREVVATSSSEHNHPPMLI